MQPSPSPAGERDSTGGARSRFSLRLGWSRSPRWRVASRIGYLLANRRDKPVGGDSFTYHYGANLLAQGHGFIDPLRYFLFGIVTPSAYHPPAYTVYLAAWSKIGVDGPLGHRMVSCLLGAAAVGVVGLIGRELGTTRARGERIGLIAAALAALSPSLWINDLHCSPSPWPSSRPPARDTRAPALPVPSDGEERRGGRCPVRAGGAQSRRARAPVPVAVHPDGAMGVTAESRRQWRRLRRTRAPVGARHRSVGGIQPLALRTTGVHLDGIGCDVGWRRVREGVRGSAGRLLGRVRSANRWPFRCRRAPDPAPRLPGSPPSRRPLARSWRRRATSRFASRRRAITPSTTSARTKAASRSSSWRGSAGSGVSSAPGRPRPSTPGSKGAGLVPARLAMLGYSLLMVA